MKKKPEKIRKKLNKKYKSYIVIYPFTIIKNTFSILLSNRRSIFLINCISKAICNVISKKNLFFIFNKQCFDNMK